jgi:hypothetical protein
MVGVVEDIASIDNIHAEGSALAMTAGAFSQHIEGLAKVKIATELEIGIALV